MSSSVEAGMSDEKQSWVADLLATYTTALRIIAGYPDALGRQHGEELGDRIAIQEYALRVLKGAPALPVTPDE